MAPAPHVLVTGASGLLGRHVSAAFADAGFTVTGADVVAAERPQAPPTVITNLAFDDLSGLFDRSPDVVVHAAAIPDLGRGRAEPDVLAENVSGTARLMFAALDAGVRRLIYVSSQSVLGLSRGPGVRPPARLPVDELHPCRPRDGYALSKKVGEDLAEILAERYDATITSIRLPVIWDPAQRKAHVEKRLSDPEQAARSNWAYVDVRDAARAIVMAGARTQPGHLIVNVAAARAFCQRPLAELVVEAYGPIPSDVDLSADPSLFGSHRAAIDLGFHPRYVWTQQDILENDER
jgi:UDP-glucose 4-epimerase